MTDIKLTETWYIRGMLRESLSMRWQTEQQQWSELKPSHAGIQLIHQGTSTNTAHLHTPHTYTLKHVIDFNFTIKIIIQRNKPNTIIPRKSISIYFQRAQGMSCH